MRELKFRAWNKKIKSMISNELILKECDRLTFVVNPLENWEIMQYTGLKDSNGVDVYESDIVTGHGTLPKIVYWCEDMAMFRIGVKGKDTQYDKTEGMLGNGWVTIIGNIYSDAHLVETHPSK